MKERATRVHAFIDNNLDSEAGLISLKEIVSHALNKL